MTKNPKQPTQTNKQPSQKLIKALVRIFEWKALEDFDTESYGEILGKEI